MKGPTFFVRHPTNLLHIMQHDLRTAGRNVIMHLKRSQERSDVCQGSNRLGDVERLHVYAQTLGIFDVAVEIVELLAIDLSFGEKNVPLMALLLALVGALGALLRFEANLLFAPGGS